MSRRRHHSQFLLAGLLLLGSANAQQPAPPPPPAYPYGNPYGNPQPNYGPPPVQPPPQAPPPQVPVGAPPPYGPNIYGQYPNATPGTPPPPSPYGQPTYYPPPPANYPYAPPPPPTNYPYPAYPPPFSPPPDPHPNRRTNDEIAFLYGTSILYGVGGGIWIDALAGVKDPGIAVIAPVLLGAAAPAGIYLWDRYGEFHGGVPSSIAAGIALGGIEGGLISATQWQNASPTGQWKFGTQSTITFLTATAGAFGGYAYGEWFRPDPRTLSFVMSSSGWGGITGTLMGAGIANRHGDWKDGATIGGLVGYNAGLAAGSGPLRRVPPFVPRSEMDVVGVRSRFGRHNAYLHRLRGDKNQRIVRARGDLNRGARGAHRRKHFCRDPARR